MPLRLDYDRLQSLRKEELEQVVRENWHSDLLAHDTKKMPLEALKFLHDALPDGMFASLLITKGKAARYSAITEAVDTRKDIIEILRLLTLEELYETLNDKDGEGCSTMHHILEVDQAPTIVRYTYGKLGSDRCIELLLEKNLAGQSSIMGAACARKRGIVEILKIFKDLDCNGSLDILLTDTDIEGKSITQYIMQSKWSGAPDRRTIYHIIDTLKGESYLKWFENFHHILSDMQLAYVKINFRKLVSNSLDKFVVAWNSSGCDKLKHTVEACNWTFPNDWTMETEKAEWIRKQTEKSCYLFIQQPSIVLIANSKHRPGAKDEAITLITAFESLGLEVTCELDQTRHQTIDLLRQAASTERGNRSQMFIMMGHGKAGYIFDNEGCSIAIEDLEEAMHSNLQPSSPKVLILQCCQSHGSEELASNYIASGEYDEATYTDSLSEEDATGSKTQKRYSRLKYAPTHSGFCAIMSCVSGQVSIRNKFIPTLANEITNWREDQTLHSIFLDAHKALNDVMQTPIIQSTMRLEFNLRNIFKPGEGSY